MAKKIAQGMHLEATVHDIQFNIQSINERLLYQQSLLHDLQEFSRTTTTKAELHAAMACLTYKNMGLALPKESLGEIIQNKFAKSEQLRPSEVQGYLANPFEALATMGKLS
jgi:5'-deoxynucleotidase YfbR-like HD superfamily hydrolase